MILWLDIWSKSLLAVCRPNCNHDDADGDHDLEEDHNDNGNNNVNNNNNNNNVDKHGDDDFDFSISHLMISHLMMILIPRFPIWWFPIRWWFWFLDFPSDVADGNSAELEDGTSCIIRPVILVMIWSSCSWWWLGGLVNVKSFWRNFFVSLCAGEQSMMELRSIY